MTFLDLFDEVRREVYDLILPRRNHTFDIADPEFADELRQSADHTEQREKAQDCIRVMLVSNRVHQDLCPIVYERITFDVMVQANIDCSHFFNKFSAYSASMIPSLILTLRRSDRGDNVNAGEPLASMNPTFASLGQASGRLTGLQLLTLIYSDEVSPLAHDVVLCPGHISDPATTANFGPELGELLKHVGFALPFLSRAVYPSDRRLWGTLFTFSRLPGALTKDGGRHFFINFDPLAPDQPGRIVHGQIVALREVLQRRSVLGAESPTFARCIEQFLRGISLPQLGFLDPPNWRS